VEKSNEFNEASRYIMLTNINPALTRVKKRKSQDAQTRLGFVLIEPQIPSIKKTGIAIASNATKNESKLVVWKHQSKKKNIKHK